MGWERPTRAEAVAALRDGWGEEAADLSVEALPGDVDVNFRVTGPDGTRSVLKFVDPDTPDSRLDLQHAALAHLVSRLDSGTVPWVIATRRREPVHSVDGRRVRRLGWLEGSLMADAIPSRLLPSSGASALMRSIGTLLGRVDDALADFTHPAAARSDRWDPAAGLWIADALDAVVEPDPARPHRRPMLERVIGGFRARVVSRLGDLPRAVIHADANDHNLLLRPASAGGPLVPAGIIDFGDMLETARICEPAVAAAYAAMRSNDPVDAIAQLVSGWAEFMAGGGRPVTDPELEVVVPLARMRLAISVVVSATRSRQRPDDPYVTVSEAPAWTLLEALDHLCAEGRERWVTDRIRRACGRGPEPSGAVPSGSSVASAPASDAHLLARRKRATGPNLSLSYGQPIHAVRGWMQYLYDAQGRAFLDLYNNVPHVGHSHPRVAEAVARQSRLLATNTRYLSQLRLDYMERLAGLFPDPLDTVYLVNSASEANELALRIVRVATGRRDLIVQETGYHGHTTSLIDISPYKADGPGGEGTPDWVHTVAIPDPYRGRHRTEASEVGPPDPPDVGARYAADVAELVERLVDELRPPGAFFAETFPSVGGQIVPPPGYLDGAYSAVRGAGGLVVADEVQTGFGRLGEAMWGFETQGVVPDLVVLGKPMANGFPMGAVVTTRALAEAFDTGMEFFSTFGGNPVACAAGAAVLDLLDGEGLQKNAARVGGRLLEGLHGLAARDHTGLRIGDVRGMGLFLGVEFVRDRATREPDADVAGAVVEGMKRGGILAGTDGPEHNVLKLRGPLVLTEEDAERAVEAVGNLV